ncbi:MAG: helix-turn-helix domain-containing protein [Clostridiales bacterium]|nr:helix-turn-helix domain-containing protein [Clostridiales bacterium]
MYKGGEKMDILKRIEELRLTRGWSIYKLTSEAGLTQSTLSNMYSRNTLPSITTLENICRAFDITLSQFFATTDEQKISDEEHVLLQRFRLLNKNEQSAVLTLCDNLKQN